LGYLPTLAAACESTADASPIDLYAYHILAYADEELAGCIRVYPLAAGGPPCSTEELLGAQRFAEVQRWIRRDRNLREPQVLEVGRWVAAPTCRAHGMVRGVGMFLAAAAAGILPALARQCGYEDWIGFSPACTAYRQDVLLEHAGLMSIPWVDSVRADSFNDTARILYCCNLAMLRPRFQRIVRAMQQTLELDEMFPESTR